jgi:hypothetical protein
MQKFLIGTALGAILSFVFVRFGLEPPAITKLPDKFKANVVATVVEGDLYDLAAEAEVQERALKVYFANRAGDAAKLDAAAGHPFLTALHRARARREAGQLNALWQAYDATLAQAALRATLETKHGTTDTEALKRAMLLDALDKKPFLKAWLTREHGAPAGETIRDLVRETSAAP